MQEPSPEERRLSFGETADRYDRFRPGYPREALVWALGEQPRRVVDLGAGTGRMTVTLLALGHHVTAVDPDPGMLAQLTRSTGGQARVVVGSAESLPLPDSSVDSVVVAQAFHWFDLDRALPELARVLTPEGSLVVAWNVRDDDVDWVEQISRLVGRYDAKSGNRDADAPEVAPTFSSVERAQFHHEQPMDAAGLVGLVSTFSYVALSPDRDSVLEQVRQIATQHPLLAGRDHFAMPYDTVVYRARKNG